MKTKSHSDSQNAARFGKKYIRMRKALRVFVEIAFGRGKRLAFSLKLHLVNQNAPRFCRNCIRTRKMPHVFAETTLGQPKRGAFWQKLRSDNQNAPRFAYSPFIAPSSQS